MWDSLKGTVHNLRHHIFKTRRWQKQNSSVPSTLDFSDSSLYFFNFRNDKHQFPPSPESPWPTKPCLINTSFPCLPLHGWKRNPNPEQHLTPQAQPHPPHNSPCGVCPDPEAWHWPQVHKLHSLCGSDPRLHLQNHTCVSLQDWCIRRHYSVRP